MKRAVESVLIAAVALLPVSAAADTNLQPPLDQVLVSGPVGYTLFKPSGLPHGFFGLDEYAAGWGGENAADASQMLQEDGFVGGYALQWTDATNTHALFENVVAFKGGKGASSWFQSGEAADQHDPSFRHADTLAGLGPDSFGEHAVMPSGEVVDAFVFARGNDVFAIGFVSTKDDVLTLVQNQATAQYAHAPDYTIPPDQWPENATTSSDAFPVAGVLIGVVVVALLGALGAGGFVLLRRPPRTSPVAAAAPPVALQMSADGKFWFDGARWVDCANEPPPFAPRSPDGAMWWNGYAWAPVPQQVQAR